MMKHYTYLLIFAILVSVLLVAPKGLSAQRDTTGTAAKTDSIIEYLTPLEYAFMMHEETKFMLRVPAFGVGAEVELLPYFTLIGQAQFNIDDAEIDNELYLTAQTRWYYGSKKIEVSNMSGNYIALAFSNPRLTSSSDFEKWQIYGSWGIQRRFLDYGLIDMGINAGYGDFIYPPNRLRPSMFGKGYFIQSRGEVGLGFVFNKLKNLDPDKICPALKCYEKETFLFKINTNNLFSLFYNLEKDQTDLRLEPEIGFEQKLFNLPVSIGVDIGLDFQWWDARITERKFSSGNNGYLNLRAGMRYYYNLKNRIRKGKSGDGLSANYISGGVYQKRYFSSILPDEFKYPITGYIFTTGIQRTFSDNLYFNVEAGLQQDPYAPGSINPAFFGDIQLGIKF